VGLEFLTSRASLTAARCLVHGAVHRGGQEEAAVGLLTDHLHHCAVNAARASEGGGQARLGEVASTIRQVIRLKDLSRTPAQPAAPPRYPLRVQ
jgi:hypothetical protein